MDGHLGLLSSKVTSACNIDYPQPTSSSLIQLQTHMFIGVALEDATRLLTHFVAQIEKRLRNFSLSR
jgi:hypothetical protein